MINQIEAVRNDLWEDSMECSQDLISIEFSEQFTGQKNKLAMVSLFHENQQKLLHG